MGGGSSPPIRERRNDRTKNLIALRGPDPNESATSLYLTDILLIRQLSFLSMNRTELLLYLSMIKPLIIDVVKGF